MNRITTHTLATYKKQQQNFAALTVYDALLAAMLEKNGIEVFLVGDSVGMVIQGFESTVSVTLETLVYHTQCVARGSKHAFIMSDMPFVTYFDTTHALKNASALIQAGAHMIKMEGGAHLCTTIRTCVQNGIPVCGHLGLLPQSIHVEGRYSVKGKSTIEANQLLDDALALQEAGIQLLVLECIPPTLAEEITQKCRIPVIGIGCGAVTNGQILVLQDVLGITPNPPKFAYNFLQDTSSIAQAVANYSQAVKMGDFPSHAQTWNETHSWKS